MQPQSELHESNTHFTHFCVFCVCVFVVRSQASTGPQAKQDGLREEVEEAWRRLESIKVPEFPLTAAGSKQASKP